MKLMRINKQIKDIGLDYNFNIPCRTKEEIRTYSIMGLDPIVSKNETVIAEVEIKGYNTRINQIEEEMFKRINTYNYMEYELEEHKAKNPFYYDIGYKYAICKNKQMSSEVFKKIEKVREYSNLENIEVTTVLPTFLGEIEKVISAFECECGFKDLEERFQYCPKCGKEIDWSLYKEVE